MGGNPIPKVDKIKNLVIKNDPQREKKLGKQCILLNHYYEIKYLGLVVFFKFVFHLQALSSGTAKTAHIDLEEFIIDFILIQMCPLFPDLYVFGVGTDVHKDDMNGLVSQRDQEQYFFMLPDLDKVQDTFDSMIGTNIHIHF